MILFGAGFDSHGDQIYVGKYNDMDNPRRLDSAYIDIYL